MGQNNGHYAYYPGCSLEQSAQAYHQSNMLVAKALGLKFQEVDDWNCCGTTEYFTLNALPAYSLVARNLSLAAKQGTTELTAPCSACYLNLQKTDRHMAEEPRLKDQVNQALAAGGLHYEPGTMHIRPLLDLIVEDVGYEAIKAKVTKSLAGLRVAPYYGCLTVRPFGDQNPEYPTHMDRLLEVLDVTVVDFPMKAHCCGGHMTQISEDTAYELIRRILHNAEKYESDIVVTMCPMCQLNLDAYQSQVNRRMGTDFNIPVLYFTQLMGLAFGASPKDVGIGQEIVSARPALAKIGKEVPKEKKPKRRDKNALPIPTLE